MDLEVFFFLQNSLRQFDLFPVGRSVRTNHYNQVLLANLLITMVLVQDEP